jgi:hypothetical protein
MNAILIEQIITTAGLLCVCGGVEPPALQNFLFYNFLFNYFLKIYISEYIFLKKTTPMLSFETTVP